MREARCKGQGLPYALCRRLGHTQCADHCSTCYLSCICCIAPYRAPVSSLSSCCCRSSSGAGGLPAPLSPLSSPGRPLLVDLVPVDYDPNRFTLRAANSPTSSTSSSGAAARPMLPAAGAQRPATLLGSSSNTGGAGLVSRSGDGGPPASPRTAARAGLFSRISSSWRASGAGSGGSTSGGEHQVAPAAPAPVAEGVEPAAQGAPSGGRSSCPAVDVASVLQALGSWDMGAAGRGFTAPGLERSGSSGSDGSPTPSPRSLSATRRTPSSLRRRGPELPLTPPMGADWVSSEWPDPGPCSPHAVVGPARQPSPGEEQEVVEAPPGAPVRPVPPRHLRGGAKKRRQNSLAFLINSAATMGPTPGSGSPPGLGLAAISGSSPGGAASRIGFGWEPRLAQPAVEAPAGGLGDTHLPVGVTNADWLCHTGGIAVAARRSRSLDLGRPGPPAAGDHLSSTAWVPHHAAEHNHHQHGPSRLSMDSSSPAPHKGTTPWRQPPGALAGAAAADTEDARVRRRSALLWGDAPSPVQQAEYSPHPAGRGQSGTALAASSSLFASAALAPLGQPGQRLQHSSSANSPGSTAASSSPQSPRAGTEQQLHHPSATAAMVTRVLNRVRASLDIRPGSQAAGAGPYNSAAASARRSRSRSTADSAGSSERRSMEMRSGSLPTIPQEGAGEEAAEAADAPGTAAAGAPQAAGPAAGSNPDSPGVMAECYKLTSAVPAEGEGGATPLQSITMIKYTNLVQQVRGGGAESASTSGELVRDGPVQGSTAWQCLCPNWHVQQAPQHVGESCRLEELRLRATPQCTTYRSLLMPLHAPVVFSCLPVAVLPVCCSTPSPPAGGISAGHDRHRAPPHGGCRHCRGGGSSSGGCACGPALPGPLQPQGRARAGCGSAAGAPSAGGSSGPAAATSPGQQGARGHHNRMLHPLIDPIRTRELDGRCMCACAMKAHAYCSSYNTTCLLQGKVRCLAHTPTRLATTTVLLPDIHQLACCQPMEEEEEGDREEREEGWEEEEAPTEARQQAGSGTSSQAAAQQVPPHLGVEVGVKAADSVSASKPVGMPGTPALVGALPGAAPVAVAQAALAARRRA